MTVVVTADDLGLSPGVTRGIFEAHRRGVVRSTSLLVTFASSAEAAALARAERDRYRDRDERGGGPRRGPGGGGGGFRRGPPRG